MSGVLHSFFTIASTISGPGTLTGHGGMAMDGGGYRTRGISSYRDSGALVANGGQLCPRAPSQFGG